MKKNVSFACFMLLAQSVFSSAFGATIRVPSDQPNIQAGITAAVNGDIVLVADGLYTGPGNRDIEFQGKAITVMSENGPGTCTIDCQGTAGVNHRGFYIHQFETPASQIIGFTIINGHMSFSGGGIYCTDASPVIRNCILTQNIANGYLVLGGAIACSENSEAMIIQCIIYGNTAYYGAGVSINRGSLQECDIFGNNAQLGGGVTIWNGSIISCRIGFNTALWNGGAVWSGAMYGPIGSLIIVDSIFESNLSEYGGAIWNEGEEITMQNCLFIHNTANHLGGAIWAAKRGSTLIQSCSFQSNQAQGGLAILGASANEIFVINSIFQDNPISEIEGPAAVMYSNVAGGYPGEGNINSDPLFVTGLLGDHYLSQVEAGQISDSPCLNAGSDPAEDICFLLSAGNVCLNDLTTRTDGIVDENAADMGFHYSLNSPTPSPTATLSPTPTPSLNPDEGTATPTQTLSPSATPTVSPTPTFPPDVIRVPQDYPTIQEAIDAANDGGMVFVSPGQYACCRLDFRGKSITVRSNDPETCVLTLAPDCDSQAYFHSNENENAILENFSFYSEEPPWPEHTREIVIANASPAINNCKFESVIIVNSQATINDCQMESVAGTVETHGNSNPSFRNCTFYDYQYPIQCNSSASFINCEIYTYGHHGGLQCLYGSSISILNCTIYDTDVGLSLDGCENVIIEDSEIYSNNTGLDARWSNLRIENSTFHDNGGQYGWGGIYLDHCQAELYQVNCIDNNGGMIVMNSEPEMLIYDCWFHRNWTDGNGGGILCVNAQIRLVDSAITNNYASWSDACKGGGVSLDNSSAIISDCMIADNESSQGGGLYSTGESEVTIQNSTFAQNTSDLIGGGCFFGNNSTASVTNSIFWMNAPNELSGSVDVTYSDIHDGHAGIGNFDSDPEFVCGLMGPFYLSQTAAGWLRDSPCIDAGSDLSENICLDTPFGEYCLDIFTTRTDGVADDGIVDVGYHYPPEAFPTETPSPTPTPTLSPTDTPMNSSTPTLAPTETPTSPSTPTPPPACTTFGCTLSMPSKFFSPGDPCFCDVQACSVEDSMLPDVYLFVALEIQGHFFFAPGFTDFDQYDISLPPGLSIFNILPAFVWPAGAGNGIATWYAAMTDAEMTEMLGSMDILTFMWTE